MEAGRRIAPLLSHHHAVAVLAADPAVGARVARGVAEVLAPSRRVILADLAGDTRGLRELSAVGDPEGILDSFTYGISLRRVARMTPIHNVLLMASGGETVERREIFESARWGRLARECRESGALLLVLARPTAPSLRVLVEQLDGAAIVGDLLSGKPAFPIIARVAVPPERPAPSARPQLRRRRMGAVAAALAAAITVALFVVWRTYAGGNPDEENVTESETVGAIIPNITDRATLTAPANPADSANAATFAVEIVSANTRDGANIELRRHRSALPAATLVPLEVGEARAVWYMVIAGAYGEARQADSLLRVARATGLLTDSAGRTLRTPLALLIDSTARAIGQLVASQHIARGVPAYALFQPDGRALIYAGAFARPEDSVLLEEQLRESGLQPVLVYRTGRTF